MIHLFVLRREKRPSLQKKNEKIHSLYRAFCVGKLARGLATENASSVRGQVGRTGGELAEATVDVKENIFVFAVFVDVFCA